MKETKHIFEVTRLKGYSDQIISDLLKKGRGHSNVTKLTPDQQPKRFGFQWNFPFVEKKISETYFGRFYQQEQQKLKALLGSTKDRIHQMANFGVYGISCADCRKVYIGQTPGAASSEHYPLARRTVSQRLV